MKKVLKDYQITFVQTRSLGGYNESPTEFMCTLGVPVDNEGNNILTIDHPYFETYAHGGDQSDTESAASWLDKIVSSGEEVTIVYHPAPDNGRPRLSIVAPALDEHILVY